MLKRSLLIFTILAILVGPALCAGAPLTPLMQAVDRGDIDAIKALLDKGADVNRRDRAIVRLGAKRDYDAVGTALIQASGNGNADVVRFLIDRGADPNAMGPDWGWSPLGVAALTGHADVIRLLMEKGADAGKAITGLGQGQLDPEYAAAAQQGIHLIGRTCYSTGRYPEAINSFKQAISLYPANSDSFAWLSYSYQASQRYDDAITAAKRAIELKPDHASAYNTLGHAYRSKKRFAESLSAYQKAIEIEPNNAVLFINIGDLFFQREDYRRATDNYTKATALTPGDTRPLFQLAITFMALGRYDDAIEAARKALALMKETSTLEGRAPLLALRSRALREKDRAEESYNDAEQAYSLDPKDWWAKMAMGLAYIDKGKYADALNILSTIEDNLGHILEAVAQAKLGDMKTAVEIYSGIPGEFLAGKSASIQSYKRSFLEALKPYVSDRKNAARSFEAKHQYREALQEYVELVKVADDPEAKAMRTHVAALAKDQPYLAAVPEEARRYVVRAEVLLKEGKFADSLTEFNSALKLAPFVPQLYFNTATVHGELKNYKLATRYMNMYIDLSPTASNIRQARDQIYEWELMMEQEGER